MTGKGQPAGVRIYLTFAANQLNHYRTPTVEAVPMTAELRRRSVIPRRRGRFPRHRLRPWLEQMYPPAIMDGLGGFRSITGTLRLRPAGGDDGHRYALIEGPVEFVLDNSQQSAYKGDLAVAVTYGTGSAEAVSLRGVMESTIPKGPEWIRMTAALESRPESDGLAPGDQSSFACVEDGARSGQRSSFSMTWSRIGQVHSLLMPVQALEQLPAGLAEVLERRPDHFRLLAGRRHLPEQPFHVSDPVRDHGGDLVVAALPPAATSPSRRASRRSMIAAHASPVTCLPPCRRRPA